MIVLLMRLLVPARIYIGPSNRKKRDNSHSFLQVECYHFYFTTYIPTRGIHSLSILVWHLCYFNASIDVSSIDLLSYCLSLPLSKNPNPEMLFFPEGKERLLIFLGYVSLKIGTQTTTEGERST